MTDTPPNANELPDRETPLADLVDEELLGTEPEVPLAADDEAVAEDAFESAVHPYETRRIAPQDDFLEAADDAEEEGDDSASADETPPPPTAKRTPDDMFQSELIRQKQGSRLPLLPLAFGLIGAGVLLLFSRITESIDITAGIGLVIVLGALTLTNIFRFFESGRRERGLFFIAMTLFVWGILLALDTILVGFVLADYWSLTLAGMGMAFVFTFLFERTHQTGLIFPGMILIFTSGVIIAVEQNLINQGIQNALSDYWYLLLAFLGLALLPTALQES